jgi:GNAT superfamily N-acetyltransferase
VARRDVLLPALRQLETRGAYFGLSARRAKRPAPRKSTRHLHETGHEGDGQQTGQSPLLGRRSGNPLQQALARREHGFGCLLAGGYYLTMEIRQLDPDEVPRIWEIDRRETHHETYVLRDGQLVAVPNYFEIPGWHPAMIEHDSPALKAADARLGAFVGDRLVGVAVLDGERLYYLYVDADFRGRGVGSSLFAAAASRVPRLLVSSIPTRNTVDFYLRRGCVLDPTPPPEQTAAEPEDIQLLYTRP